jgi:hypothetical protein
MDISSEWFDFLRYFDQSIALNSKARKPTTTLPEKIQIPIFFKYFDEPFSNVPTNAITIVSIDRSAKVNFNFVAMWGIITF